MKYPQYLVIGNWLFMRVVPDHFAQRDNPVGGPIPENLYITLFSFRAFDLAKDLRTYENLIAKGATEPSDAELLRLLK